MTKPYTAKFLAAEKRRTTIHDHQRRICVLKEAARQIKERETRREKS